MDNGEQAPKVPFSQLGQVDSDFALAKILQQQERAFMMLTMDRDEYGNDIDESDEDFSDEDEDDEEYIVDVIEETEQDSREMEEIAEEVGEVEDQEEEHYDSQDMDAEALSYEELTALGELVGKESRGLPKDALSAFPSSIYKCDDGIDECVICRVDYEEGDVRVGLPCKHLYHTDCIKQWLEMNRFCPICSKVVSSPPSNGHST